ncbi:MAG: hypothetical protein NTY48_03830 [Candidatus Diapherotrites archaeon]|nr:hypothetical protein [Candidatus Diapherotrites archaeon]
MELKAQGAIEYLLIIGAAILVVAIVLLALTGALNSGTTQGSNAQETQQEQSQKLKCLADCTNLGKPCIEEGTTNKINCGKFADLCNADAGCTKKR